MFRGGIMGKRLLKIFSCAAAAMLVLGAGACGGGDAEESLNPTVSATPDVKPEEGEEKNSVTPDIEKDKEEKDKEESGDTGDQETDKTSGEGTEDIKGQEDGVDNLLPVTYTKIDITEDMITSSEPWNNGPDVAANAFDGDVSTFFDGLEEGFIRVDLKGEYLIGKIGYAPRSGYESRLCGTFYGSLDGRTWHEIYQIKSAPSAMKETDYTEFATVSRFRYIKYENINDCANISEMVLYSAEGIPAELVAEIGRETYADGSYEMLDEIPQDRGMIQAGIDFERLDDVSRAACDNNPSTVAKAQEGGEIVLVLDREYTLSAIAYMGGEDGEVTPSNLDGGEFYGSADGEEWVLLYEIETPPDTVCSTFVYYGELLTTGSYRYVKYQNPNGVTAISEIRVYAMETSLSVSLAALPFATNAKGEVNNIALYWGSSLEAEIYEIYRAGEGGKFELVHTGRGTSWQDYDLPVGNYTYRMELKNGSTKLVSNEAKVQCTAMPEAELKVLNNQQAGNGLSMRAGICNEEIYYSYNISVTAGKAKVVEQTSKDGYNFGNERIVVASDAHELLRSCKIESAKTVYVKEQNKVVIVAHWEKPDGYADGKLLLVTGTPGGEFTLHGIWNPEDIEVRDMSVFVDDDGTGYLLAAANKPGEGANASIYIFRFTQDFSGIEGIVTVLFENQYREMPNVVKADGWYYLFLSQAAGWYPSSGAYASSRSMEEGWSELRPIGNTSTFSSQSSWIAVLGEGEKKNYLMHAYRWIAGEGTSSTMIAPVLFADGIAYYDYFPKILYNDRTGDMVPLAPGRLLSADCPVTATLGAAKGCEASNVTDGDYFSSYTADSAAWPVSLTIDLKRECELTNLQISWYICKGSEGYYMYDVYGSTDGENWNILHENTNEKDTRVSKTYGFNVNPLSGVARYVKITVNGARLQNNPDNNWYTPTIYEVKVFGK